MRPARSVYACVTRTSYQKARPPFVASAVIQSDDMQVRINFNAAVTFGQADRTLIAGSLGTLECLGPSLSEQRIRLSTAAGIASPDLTGTWFTNGFQGTMCELLCAIEEKREPRNSARNNLRTLALCFAAISSANSGTPVLPGSGTHPVNLNPSSSMNTLHHFIPLRWRATWPGSPHRACVVLAVCIVVLLCKARAADDYQPGPDSKPQDGVPKGTVQKFTLIGSKIFPGTDTRIGSTCPRSTTRPSRPACMSTRTASRITRPPCSTS